MKLPTLHSGLIYTAANIASAGIPFLLIPVLTRALTPAEYGKVVSFYMLIAVAACVAGLSSHGAVGVRWMAHTRGDPRSFTGAALLVTFFTSSLAMIAAAVIGPMFKLGLGALPCAMAALTAGTMVVQGSRFAVWQVKGEALKAGALQVGSAALNLGLSLAAVLLLGWGGFGRIAGITIAGVLITVVAVATLGRENSIAKPRRRDVGEVIRFGAPLMPHVLAGALLTNADRFAVSAQLGTAALGIYGAATQLGQIMGVLADAISKTYMPTIYKMLAQDSRRSKLKLVAALYLSVPGWLAVAAMMWPVLLLASHFLLGPRYQEAGHLAFWFLLGGALNAIYTNISALFFFKSRTEFLSVCTVTTATLSFLSAGFAVRTLGIDGGGATYVLAQLVLLVMTVVLSLRISPLPWNRPALAMRVLFRRTQAGGAV